MRHLIVVLWIVSIFCCKHPLTAIVAEASSSSSGSSSSSSSSDLSPVDNFEPSWAASCAQSTIVAVSYPMVEDDDGEAVVIVIGSTTSSSSSTAISSSSSETTHSCERRERRNDDNDDENVDNTASSFDSENGWISFEGVRVLFHGTDSITVADEAWCSPQWTVLGTSAICCCTGLASDADYLSRVLQRRADLHRFVYDSDEPADLERVNHALAVRLVDGLSSLLYAPTQYRGKRPFGVQALVLGVAAAPALAPPTAGSNRQPRRRRTVDLWTLDPSGGHRHWQAATAIGRSALPVRRELHSLLSARASGDNSGGRPPDCASTALRICLCALLTARKKLSFRLQDDCLAGYKALLVWVSPAGNIAVGTIDPNCVRECGESIVKELSSESSLS